jgi:hypothetical protein
MQTPRKRKTRRKLKLPVVQTETQFEIPVPNSRTQHDLKLNRHSLVEVKFYDRLQRLCSLGEGFPTDVPTLMLGGATPATKIGHLSRMDLNQAQVQYLLPFLEHFARTGRLPIPNDRRPRPSGD